MGFRLLRIGKQVGSLQYVCVSKTTEQGRVYWQDRALFCLCKRFNWPGPLARSMLGNIGSMGGGGSFVEITFVYPHTSGDNSNVP